MKNVRNNLLNGKKVCLSRIQFNKTCWKIDFNIQTIVGLNIDINFPAGFIQWKDLHDINDKDKGLSANLNNVPKLSYQALHPGNNKQRQSVPVAPAIIHETTIAAPEAIFLLDQIYLDF